VQAIDILVVFRNSGKEHLYRLDQFHSSFPDSDLKVKAETYHSEALRKLGTSQTMTTMCGAILMGEVASYKILYGWR
jgi:hypothetical protein